MQPRGRFWGRQSGAAGAVFFQSPAGGRELYRYRGKLPIRFDSFLFGWMKIFHPSCQSLAFSAPSAYYYNKNPSRFCTDLPTGCRKEPIAMTITEQKAAQRKAGIAARRALSDTQRTHSNAALCARIMALDCFKRQKTSCFMRPSAARPTSRRWLWKRPGRAKRWPTPSAARAFR